MKTQAFRVKMTIPSQSWSSGATLLTANSIEEARDKGIAILHATPEHIIEVEEIEVFSTDEKIEVNNYPYGRLRCTAFFSVENVKNKGYRDVFQTINPKTLRLNAEKKSTYAMFILQYKNSEGHIKQSHFGNGGLDSLQLNKMMHLMNDFYNILTPNEISDLTISLVAMSKVNAKAMVAYARVNWEELKPLITRSTETLCQIVNSKENRFLECLLDINAINALKEKTKDEPVFVRSEPISLMSMVKG